MGSGHKNPVFKNLLFSSNLVFKVIDGFSEGFDPLLALGGPTLPQLPFDQLCCNETTTNSATAFDPAAGNFTNGSGSSNYDTLADDSGLVLRSTNDSFNHHQVSV